MKLIIRNGNRLFLLIILTRYYVNILYNVILWTFEYM